MLERYLPQVMQYSSSDAEVFVADNASTDNSVEFVSQHFPTCNADSIRLRNYWLCSEVD